MSPQRCPDCYARLTGVHICERPSAPRDAPKRRASTPRRSVAPTRRPAGSAPNPAAYSHPFNIDNLKAAQAATAADQLARARTALTATQQAFTLAAVAAEEGDVAAARFNLATIAEVCAAALRPAPDHSNVEPTYTGKEQAA